MTEKKAFIKASAILSAILLLTAGLLIILYIFSNTQVINTLLLILAGILTLLTISIIIGMLFFINNKDKVENTKGLRTFYSFSKKFILPLIKPFSKTFGIDNDELERFFIDTNNKVLESEQKTFENNEIVLLLPHCLQDNSCNANITNNINNCKRCGKCDINTMISIADKYGITLLVVTGGSAARSKLSKIKPGAVVAVACERDLASGINDVKDIPVYGVLNMRPNGPCNNTRVDAKKIEEAIERLVSKSSSPDQGKCIN